MGYWNGRLCSLIKASNNVQDVGYGGTLDELLDVLLELESLRGRNRVLVVGELEELLRQVRVPSLVQAAFLPHAPRDRPQDGQGQEAHQRYLVGPPRAGFSPAAVAASCTFVMGTSPCPATYLGRSSQALSE